MVLPPLAILAIGIIIVLTLIIAFRIHAFLALISAAIVVSLLAPGDLAHKIDRVALAFGNTTYKIGILIALAAVIGRCLIDSGAADRIVRMFVGLLGEKNCPISLMSSGFVLSVPVFFDTVFYLLLPLARSMHKQTGRSFLLLVLAMGAGASITHSLVPPTPGPLLIAAEFGIDIGTMIMVGSLLALCTAIVMYFFIGWYSRLFDIPMRSIQGGEDESENRVAEKLPGLFASLLPIVLPVAMISVHTIVKAIADTAAPEGTIHKIENWTAVIGNANFAMLAAAAVALFVFWQQRRPTKEAMAKMIESSLASGGVIILITAGGGAFGGMLQEAGIGEALKSFMESGDGGMGGVGLLLLGFFVAFIMKFAQGSSTVAMITASGILGAFVGPDSSLDCHVVYVACAIGFGAQCGNWMNDSGFWIFAKMSGLTEVETLKTWSVTVSLLAVVGLFFTILFSRIMPLV